MSTKLMKTDLLFFDHFAIRIESESEEAKTTAEEMKENAQRKWKKDPNELAAKILGKRTPTTTSTRTTAQANAGEPDPGCCVLS